MKEFDRMRMNLGEPRRSNILQLDTRIAPLPALQATATRLNH
jgi:hypothetical protein